MKIENAIIICRLPNETMQTVTIGTDTMALILNDIINDSKKNEIELSMKILENIDLIQNETLLSISEYVKLIRAFV